VARAEQEQRTCHSQCSFGTDAGIGVYMKDMCVCVCVWDGEVRASERDGGRERERRVTLPALSSEPEGHHVA